MAKKRTVKETAARNAYIILKGGRIYEEEEHCPLIIEVITDPKRGTIAAFCREAVVSDHTFYKWLDTYPVFYDCFRYAVMTARYNWEQEGEDNKDNPEFDKDYWSKSGSYKFALGAKSKIRICVNEDDDPYKQYQQLIKQASRGEFTSDELKQVMECLNSGTRVYEAFKVQKEIDELKKDIKEMGGTHGNNNIVPITSLAKADSHSVSD